MTSTIALIERLKERAEGYRQSGPSAEHTAILLDEAATELTTLLQREAELRAAVAELLPLIPSFGYGIPERQKQRLAISRVQSALERAP